MYFHIVLAALAFLFQLKRFFFGCFPFSALGLFESMGPSKWIGTQVDIHSTPIVVNSSKTISIMQFIKRFFFLKISLSFKQKMFEAWLPWTHSKFLFHIWCLRLRYRHLQWFIMVYILIKAFGSNMWVRFETFSAFSIQTILLFANFCKVVVKFSLENDSLEILFSNSIIRLVIRSCYMKTLVVQIFLHIYIFSRRFT